MQKLTCDECGTKFNCGAPPGKDHCWCMELPNLRESFDLAGKCVCPDCMTLGKAKAFGVAVSETVTDTTPEGMRFSEAMITSPGGHAILIYELTPAQ